MMQRRDAGIEWIITEPVTGEETDKGTRIFRADGETCLMTTEPNGNTLFDGRYIDVGDDHMLFIAVADEIAASGHSEPDVDES